MSDDDPFEELDEAVGDRDGDPFDRLGDSDEKRDGERSRSQWGEPLEPDATDESDRESSDDAPAVKRDGPETGPAGEASRPHEGDPFESMSDAFTEMEVQGVDPDEVWQRLSSAESAGSITREAERTYAEVSKHSYCEQCEYFSEPPDVECSAEGTEIVEFLDMERVRVVDCPVVAERKDLEGE